MTDTNHWGSPYEAHSQKPAQLTTTWAWLYSTTGMVIPSVTAGTYDFDHVASMVHWGAQFFSNGGSAMDPDDFENATHTSLIDGSGVRGNNKPGIDYRDPGGFFLSFSWWAINASTSVGSGHKCEVILGIHSGAKVTGLQEGNAEHGLVHITPPMEIWGSGLGTSMAGGLSTPAWPRQSYVNGVSDYALIINEFAKLPGIWSLRVISQNLVGTAAPMLHHHTMFTSRRICGSMNRNLPPDLGS